MKPYKICVGIRYQHNFPLRDNIGKVIKLLAKESKSPLGNDFFHHFGTSPGESGDYLLRRADNKTYLRINSTDIIFEYILGSENFETQFEWIKDKVLPYIVNEVLIKQSIGEIMRIGIIFGFTCPTHEISKVVAASIIPDKFDVPNGLEFRLTKRYGTNLALSNDKVQDYRNLILTFNFPEGKKEGILDYDFQYYFNPNLANPIDFNFQKFLADAKFDLGQHKIPSLAPAAAA